jgi:glycosyltransferase involved in cell wall biosynthesis
MYKELSGTPSIAIIVPAFNAASTIGATLDSALAQDGVTEIVVVNDGSTDGTLAVARRFEPHVRVLTGPNCGVSSARNRGIAETSAEWLLFLDSDDLLEPKTVAHRWSAADLSGADVVVCDWRDLLDQESGVATPGDRHSVDWAKLRHDAELATATSFWAPPAALLYRRDIVIRIGGYRADLPVIQDARFLFDAAFHSARFTYVSDIGASYRILQGSLSRRNPVHFWLDVLLNASQIESLWRERNALSAERLQALCDIYNGAARGLFAAAHPTYFEAVRRQRALGLPLSRHSRVAAPMARTLGLRTARSFLGLARLG